MKTQETQREWREIAIDLRVNLNAWSDSSASLARASGANYYAVNRMLKGGLLKRSKAAIKLCIYFGINTNNANLKQAQLKESLHADLDQVWDGSVAHAKLLQKLIRSTKGFGVQEKA